jgi:hypothetical protein
VTCGYQPLTSGFGLGECIEDTCANVGKRGPARVPPRDLARRAKLSSYSVYAVFTPTSQARINFVERKAVNDQLVDALRTPGKQLVVYGESGSGKSTLLLKKLEETYPDHITSRCSSSMTFNQLLLDGFDQLDPFYVASSSTTRGRSVSPHWSRTSPA